MYFPESKSNFDIIFSLGNVVPQRLSHPLFYGTNTDSSKALRLLHMVPSSNEDC